MAVTSRTRNTTAMVTRQATRAPGFISRLEPAGEETFNTFLGAPREHQLSPKTCFFCLLLLQEEEEGVSLSPTLGVLTIIWGEKQPEVLNSSSLQLGGLVSQPKPRCFGSCNASSHAQPMTGSSDLEHALILTSAQRNICFL